MKRSSIVMTLVAVSSLAFAAMSIAQSPMSTSGDGKPAGKKSLGGSGEIVSFSLPAGEGKLAGIRIHGSRYGTAEAPSEKFLIYFLSEDMSEVLHTEMAPYSLFERGPEKWVDVNFRKPIKVPEGIFWVALDFRAGRTKGVYVSYDGSTDGKRSRVGLPGVEPKQPDFAGNWMIDVICLAQNP